MGEHVREFRGADAGEIAWRRRAEAYRGARARQRRQLVAVALGPRYRQVGRKGPGRGTRYGATRQGANAARGACRPAGEVDQSGQDEGAARRMTPLASVASQRITLS